MSSYEGKNAQNIQCWSPLYESLEHECVLQFVLEDRQIWRTHHDHSLWVRLAAKMPGGSSAARSELVEAAPLSTWPMAMAARLTCSYTALHSVHADSGLY